MTPLHTHSSYSILESPILIPSLIERVSQDNISSLALTDRGNLFGIVEFYKSCKAKNIKPIIGAELWVAEGNRKEKKKQSNMPAAFSCVFLAMNNKGYHNLCKLSSKAYTEGFYYVPRIDLELIQEHSEGLICLIGSFFSKPYFLCQQNKELEIEKEIMQFQEIFADKLYLELQRYETPSDAVEEIWLSQKYQEHFQIREKLNQIFLTLSSTKSIPVVATAETFYLEPEDWRAQEILMNVQSGQACEIWELDSRGDRKARVPNPKREVLPSRSFYYHSLQEMQKLFSDIPQAVEESCKIAQRCNVELDFTTKHYPVFVPPSLENKTYTTEEREKAAEEFLLQLCHEGITKRYTAEILAKVQEKYPGKDPLEIVKDRLDKEFQIISSKGMCDYLLIVYDFISWAKKNSIPVGPGRGSAAGSIISYLIGITDIEPLRFHLFFERFINPERVSYPDIDVDICMHRRQEVIDYTIQRYGKEKVAQIITFGTMKAKMAIKDVGRVLSVPLAKVNEIAKLVPEDPTMTLDKALQLDPQLMEMCEQDIDAKRIIEMAKKLEGSIRNTSIHAAGLIISANSITEHIPICVAKDAQMIVTQFAMKPVEAVGMLKIDFLGLKTLTSIQKTVDFIYEGSNTVIDWANLPLDDKATYSLLNQGKTLGVFQVESGGMRELLKQLHIEFFEEVIAVGALYRPGPMDMIPSFIQRKHGQEKIEIDHPLMEDILQETYGVMVYQEQVMQIASKLAGYSLGEGDVLRRAMGKKDHAEMNRQKEKFTTGCVANNIEEKTAEAIFSKIEKFASYGFNKSHAAAYAYLTYTTAYFKANYPKEWMAALMTCDRDDITKVAKYLQEAKNLHIAILPPDVNDAGTEFTPTKEGIRFAIPGIKGVGEGVVNAIIEERKKKGSFSSLYDFIRRVDASKIGKKSIELLIAAGCFDFTLWNRDALKLFVEQHYESIVKEQKEKEMGVLDLFAADGQIDQNFLIPPEVLNPTPALETLQLEKELLGFYLTGHPMQGYRPYLEKLECIPLRELTEREAGVYKIAFIIENIKFKISPRTQKKFAVLTISDGDVKFEILIWNDFYDRHSSILVEKALLFGIASAEPMQSDIRLSMRFITELASLSEESLPELEEQYSQIKKQQKAKKKMEKKKQEHLILTCAASKMRLSNILQLKDLFRRYSGNVSIDIHLVHVEKGKAKISIPTNWGVTLHPDFEKSLAQLSFIQKVEKEEIA